MSTRRECCNQNCNQGRNCEVRMPKRIGMCDAEREMVDAARRDRNCVLGIVATLVIGYLLLCWIGGAGI